MTLEGFSLHCHRYTKVRNTYWFNKSDIFTHNMRLFSLQQFWPRSTVSSSTQTLCGFSIFPPSYSCWFTGNDMMLIKWKNNEGGETFTSSSIMRVCGGGWRLKMARSRNLSVMWWATAMFASNMNSSINLHTTRDQWWKYKFRGPGTVKMTGALCFGSRALP